MWRRIRSNRAFQVAAGTAFASYFHFAAATTRFITDPADTYDTIDAKLPAIFTFWHGQHFLTPFMMLPHHKAKVLISRHGDAEINAIAAQKLGCEIIRGSGATSAKDFHRKGAVSATYAMIEALEEGWNVAMTADVPKIARRAGLGVVTVARYSGRPIIPVAMTTRNQIRLKSWDRASLNLPFGPGATVVGEPVYVAPDVDTAGLEAARALVQQRLEEVSVRAEEICYRRNIKA